jgi:hypothetical protein
VFALVPGLASAPSAAATFAWPPTDPAATVRSLLSAADASEALLPAGPEDDPLAGSRARALAQAQAQAQAAPAPASAQLLSPPRARTAAAGSRATLGPSIAAVHAGPWFPPAAASAPLPTTPPARTAPPAAPPTAASPPPTSLASPKPSRTVAVASRRSVRFSPRQAGPAFAPGSPA